MTEAEKKSVLFVPAPRAPVPLAPPLAPSWPLMSPGSIVLAAFDGWKYLEEVFERDSDWPGGDRRLPEDLPKGQE